MDSPYIPFLSLLGAFAVVAVIGKPAIALLHQLKFGQPIREEGPRSHLSKKGTPTMGGLLIWIGTLIGAIPALHDSDSLLLLGMFFAYGLIGLADDLMKVVFKNPRGVPARIRLVLQLALAAGFLYLITGPEQTVQIWGQLSITVPRLLYIIVGSLLLAGTVNAVNFTDGVDGLLATVLIPTLAFFVIIAASVTGQSLIMAVIGSLIGYLLFNHHPAKVFMGDTGSLALGALVGSLFFIYGVELLMPLICLLYWFELLSVIIQVTSFKTRGVRVFKMTPIHHHFELSGWKENKIVAVFGLFALATALLGVVIYPYFTGAPLW